MKTALLLQCFGDGGQRSHQLASKLTVAGTKLPKVLGLCFVCIQSSDLVITHGFLSHLGLQELRSLLCHADLE